MNKAITKTALLALLAIVLPGCHGMVWGNMFALGVTFCLFFGTLSLGRRQQPPTGSLPSASATASSHGVPATATAKSSPRA